MSKEIISDKQGVSIIVFFVMGTTLLIGAAGEAGKDVWIAIILAMAAGILISLVYARILFLYPQKNLFEILELIFGKLVGKIIGLIYLWYAFHLSTLVLRNFAEFIDSVALPESPMIVSMLFITALCGWVVKEGIEVLARVSEIFIVIVLSIIAVIQILVIPQLDINNISPVLGKGFSHVLTGAFSAFTFPFAEPVVFMLIFSCLKWKKSAYKTYIIGIALGGIFILIISVRNLLVLGTEILSMLYFPSYFAVTRVNIANFLQRLEIGVSIVFIVCVFVKLSVCLLAVMKGVASIFNINDYKFIITPICILTINVSYILYENTMEMTQWAFKVYPYYAIPFQIILPIIILIAAEVKKRFSQSK